MQINKISSSQNFGMDIKAPKSFLAALNEDITKNPQTGNSKKLAKNVNKIINTLVWDTYEIEEINKPFVKENKIKLLDVSKDLNKVFLNACKEKRPSSFTYSEYYTNVGYRLLNKTKNLIVLEKTTNQYLKFLPEVTPANFIQYIAKNLKKIKELDKQVKLL